MSKGRRSKLGKKIKGKEKSQRGNERRKGTVRKRTGKI